MIKIDFKNIFACPSAGVSEAKWRALGKDLPRLIKQLKTRGQGFHSVIDDAKTAGEIIKFAKAQRGKFESLVVLGIGGSALGLLAISQALNNIYHNEAGARGKRTPKLYVLDNIDPALIRETEEQLNLAKTLFIVISKSGTTAETVSQYLYFRKKIAQKKLLIKKHFVFITDAKTGWLRQVANAEKISAFSIPNNIGGRWSVLTPVGLLPAALMGIDIQKILASARQGRSSIFLANFSANLAWQMASAQYLLYHQGRSINVLMPYAQHLWRLADWYRQLLAESIGKVKNRRGEQVNVGITPVTALGVTDQHSQLQLYSEGPEDKLIIFVRVSEAGKKISIPLLTKTEVEFSFLRGVSFNKLFDVEYQGTAAALTKNNRPNFTINIKRVDEQTLGELFMLFEGAVAFLGELFNVDAFNQPGVELSKKMTRDLLKNS
ncbi:MAG: glucose-6-phosphate isomerase [Candidatus Magasanikbacteria bacterium]|nr:glucose-6-phosphate isomerase [Candidatus Magasanikbacteria bacterium]